MIICRGRTRTVLLIGILAIKLPVVNPIFALKNLFEDLSYLQKWLFNKSLRAKPEIFQKMFWSYKYPGTLGSQLFRGIMANIWERRLYKETKNRFLLPTYFSLLGLINFQKTGDPLNMERSKFACQIISLTSMKEAFCDSHCLLDPKNFCWVDGHLKILDYGNEQCHDFIRKYGNKLYDSFSLEYSWEENE